MRMFRIHFAWVIIVGIYTLESTRAQDGFLDHLLLTLDEPDYFNMRQGLRSAGGFSFTIIDDPSNTKFLLYDSGGTYIEFWNGRFIRRFGHQEANRVANPRQLFQVARRLGARPKTYPGTQVVTLDRGRAPHFDINPYGGLFHILSGVDRPLAPGLGIRGIVKSVPAQVFFELIEDYNLSGYRIRHLSHRLLIAMDRKGIQRVVAMVDRLEQSELMAVNFRTAPSMKHSSIVISRDRIGHPKHFLSGPNLILNRQCVGLLGLL